MNRVSVLLLGAGSERMRKCPGTVGMSKRHHLGSCDLKVKPASCMGGPDVDRRPMTTVKLSRNESTSLV